MHRAIFKECKGSLFFLKSQSIVYKRIHFSPKTLCTFLLGSMLGKLGSMSYENPVLQV